MRWELPNGLTLLSGTNKDTGGSNMAGKTTLLDAWFWARYGWLPKWDGPKGGPADAVIRRGSDGKCWVEVTETIGNDEIKYRRSRPAKLQVWVNGELQKSMKQPEFEELLGMSAQRFLVCVYFSQKRKRSFYHMSDTERTELLSIIANLEKLDEGLKKAKGQRDAAKALLEHQNGRLGVLTETAIEHPDQLHAADDEVDLSESRMEEINHEMANEKDLIDKRKETFKEIEKDKTDMALKRVNIQLAALCQEKDVHVEQVKAADKVLKQKRVLLQKMPTIDPVYQEQVVHWEETLNKANAINESHKNQRVENAVNTEKMCEQMNLAEAASKGNCSSCGQELPKEEREKKMREHLDNAEKFKAMIIQPKPLVDTAPIMAGLKTAQNDLHNARVRVESAPAELQKEIAELEKERQRVHHLSISKDIEMKQLQDRLDQEVAGYAEECKKSIEDDYKKYQELEAAYAQEQIRFKGAEKRRKEIMADIKKTEASIKETKEKIKDNQEELNLQLDLIDLFGPKGYRSVCFDGLVSRIGDRAGHLLSIMTEGLYTTYIDQVGQDSKGSQKMILKPTLIKDGKEIPIDDLSGGAEARVALAYDVAVSEAAGEGMPLLLDETLEGLDAVGKEEAMFLLEEVAKSRPVIIVDHASEFKAMFNQVQEIIYENKTSRLGELTIA